MGHRGDFSSFGGSLFKSVVVQLLSPVWLFVTPWIAARQASLSMTNSRSLLKLMSIESMMPSNHLILCHPLLLPSIFPSIRVFSSELTAKRRIPGTLPVDKLSVRPCMSTCSIFLHFPRGSLSCLEKNLRVANLLPLNCILAVMFWWYVFRIQLPGKEPGSLRAAWGVQTEWGGGHLGSWLSVSWGDVCVLGLAAAALYVVLWARGPGCEVTVFVVAVCREHP